MVSASEKEREKREAEPGESPREKRERKRTPKRILSLFQYLPDPTDGMSEVRRAWLHLWQRGWPQNKHVDATHTIPTRRR